MQNVQTWICAYIYNTVLLRSICTGTCAFPHYQTYGGTERSTDSQRGVVLNCTALWYVMFKLKCCVLLHVLLLQRWSSWSTGREDRRDWTTSGTWWASRRRRWDNAPKLKVCMSQCICFISQNFVSLERKQNHTSNIPTSLVSSHWQTSNTHYWLKVPWAFPIYVTFCDHPYRFQVIFTQHHT